MRKLISMLLALVMVLSVCPAAFAADAEDMTGKTVILHTNDVHGAVAGYACVAALRSEYEARGAEVITVDAGDFSQGSTYVNVSKGLDAVMLMNAAGYDFVGLGNHEFDYGYERLVENMKEAEFRVLCSDVLKDDGTPIFEPNAVYTTKDGVKIGFFGLETPEAQTKANPALIKGLTFLSNDTETTIWQNAQAQVDALRAAGADIVICLSHLGIDTESVPYRSYELNKETTGIDLIIDAHSHVVMVEGENGEPIQSTGLKFENIGVVVIDNAEKKIEEHTLVTVSDELAKDPEVAKAAQNVIDAVDAAFSSVIGRSEVELNGEKEICAQVPNGNRDGETNSGDLITDAMVWFLTEYYPGSITGVDADHIVAVTNGGGIRAWIHEGDVTKQNVLDMLPFGNTLEVVYVTGAELLEALEASTFILPASSIGGFPQVSGMNFIIDVSEEYDKNETTYPDSTYYGPASIKRVSFKDVNGKPFSLTDKYAVLTNNFCADGGDTYYAFASATDKFDTGYTIDSVVMEYIVEKLGGVIGKEYENPQGRITLTGRLERLSGDTRIETAVAISREGWPQGAKNVVLASSQSYADALAATPLAYRLDAPILLTAGDKELEKAVQEELSRLGAQEVYIVGGASVISSDILEELTNSFITRRIAGDTRYQTAVAIAEKLDSLSEEKFEKVIFVSGEDFPDALSAGPAAAIADMPILYVSRTGELDADTAEYVGGLKCPAYLLGGPVAVSDKGLASIVESCGGVARIYGDDRYQTAEKVYEEFKAGFSGKYVTVATGKAFPDALAGGVLAAKNSSPMLLTSDDPGDLILELAGSAGKVFILGGTAAVSEAVNNEISSVMGASNVTDNTSLIAK